MGNHKQITVKITAIDSIKISEVNKRIDGWGDEASGVDVSGKIVAMMVEKNGQSQFGVRILEDGSIIVTNYRGQYRTTVETNLRLENQRPWTTHSST